LKRLFIPSGIKTQDLLAKHKDNKLNKKTKKIEYAHNPKFADKYIYLLHYLILARTLDKRLTTESYIPVNAKIFEKYVTSHHCAKIIKFWLDCKVIEREPVPKGKIGYIVGEKSISYRFTAAYANQRVIDVGYSDEKFEKKVAQLTKQFKEGKLDVTVAANAFIYFNLQELRINAVAAHLEINQLLASGKFSLDKANLATVRIQSISEKNFFCVRDITGHRIHNDWVTLNKKLKRFCYISTGEQLINIDVKNSQPVILSVLLKTFLSVLPADVSHYIELCEAGKFYEFLAGKFGIDITDEEARDAFKKILFKNIFYGRNQDAQKYAEWHCFKAEFPNVAEFITDYKRSNYKALSIALQRLESEIMLEGVIGKIAAVNNPADFFALTVHDSITTTLDNQELVEELMKNEFNLRGINPTFETKYIN
jgi:hypothetical protein